MTNDTVNNNSMDSPFLLNKNSFQSSGAGNGGNTNNSSNSKNPSMPFPIIIKEPKSRFKDVLITMLILLFFSSMLYLSFNEINTGNVMKIKIYGPIVQSPARGYVSSEEIISLIDDAEKNPRVKAVIFDINSGGGSASPCYEIMERVSRMEKPTYSYVREVGASGAYWIASATDKIYATPMSVVGSIGVISSYLSFEEFFKEYNITHERLVAGKYKDIGSVLKTMTDEEKEIIQKRLDNIHNYFMDSVAKNRNISNEEIENIANGLYYNSDEGLDLDLVDTIVPYDVMVSEIEKELEIEAEIYEIVKKVNIFDLMQISMDRFSESLSLALSKNLNLNKDSTFVPKTN